VIVIYDLFLILLIVVLSLSVILIVTQYHTDTLGHSDTDTHRVINNSNTVVDFCMFSCCCPRSAFRLSEIPIVDISGCRSLEMPKVGVSDCRSTEIRHFGFPISATKEKPYLLLYIKASEFQCSSVYYWSSLAEDLQYYIILHQWFPTWGEFPPRGKFGHFRGGIKILKKILTFLSSCKLHVYACL